MQPGKGRVVTTSILRGTIMVGLAEARGEDLECVRQADDQKKAPGGKEMSKSILSFRAGGKREKKKKRRHVCIRRFGQEGKEGKKEEKDFWSAQKYSKMPQ